MNPVSQRIGRTPYGHNLAVSQQARFGQNSEGTTSQAGTGEGGKKFHLDLGEGVSRMLKMTFFRPFASLMELVVLGLMTGGISTIVFPVKHFLEGLLHVDSLFMTRTFTGFNNWKVPYGRTAQEMLVEGKSAQQ